MFIRAFASNNRGLNHPLLLIADCLVEQNFADALAQSTGCRVDLLYTDTSRATRQSKFGRHFSYILLALEARKRASEYKHIVFWQQYVGLYWSMLPNSFLGKAPSVFILTFIYKERQGFLGALQRRLINRLLKNRFVRGIVCFSSAEVGFYQKTFTDEHNKFCFIHFGSDVGTTVPSSINDAKTGEPAGIVNLQAESADYLFSGGTSNRDFNTLASAVKDIRMPVYIACTKRTAHEISWPTNVEVFTEAYGSAFYRLIDQSSGVIITLADQTISSGQIVLLMAMKAGKPLIVTASSGVQDYIDDSCAWLVPPHDVSALYSVLKRVASSDTEVLAKARRGHDRYLAKFTAMQFGRRIGECINSMSVEKYK